MEAKEIKEREIPLWYHRSGGKISIKYHGKRLPRSIKKHMKAKMGIR